MNYQQLKSTPTAVLSRANEQQQCDAWGCRKGRTGLHHFCAVHRHLKVQYGHPAQRAIKREVIEPQRAAARALVVANQVDHPGLRRGISYVKDWMQAGADAAIAGKSTTGAKELLRLVRAGVEGSDVVAEMAATYSYLQSNPRAVRDDACFDVALSRAVLGLAPPERRACGAKGNQYAVRPSASALTYIGRHLRMTLSALIVNLAAAIETPEQSAERHERDALAPLRLPNALPQPSPGLSPCSLPLPGMKETA